MSSLSDMIERHILSFFLNATTVNLSRSGVASLFNCSPSQITYVIATRFTIDRGFITDSKKGGAGYIKISKISDDDYLSDLIMGGIGNSITVDRAMHICDRMFFEKVIDSSEHTLICAALSDRAMPQNTDKDIVRAGILKALIEALLKE